MPRLRHRLCVIIDALPSGLSPSVAGVARWAVATLVAFARLGWASPQFVQVGEHEARNQTTNEVVLPMPSQAGNVLVVYVYSTEPNTTISPGYTLIGAPSQLSGYQLWVYAYVVPTAGVVTTTISSPTAYLTNVVVAEFSGLTTPLIVDDLEVGFGSSLSVTSSPVTALEQSLVLYHLGLSNIDGSLDAGAPYSTSIGDWYGFHVTTVAGDYGVSGEVSAVTGAWLTHLVALRGFGVADAGRVSDAGVLDAGVVDAGVVDAGAADAGAADAGAADAGPGPDAGLPADAGLALDAGLPEETQDGGMRVPLVYRVGCHCQHSGGELMLLMLSGISLFRLRRRRH